MAVDKSIGNEEYALLGVENMHSGKGVILFAYADNLLGHLDGVRVLGVQTGDKRVGIASLYHHHTKVVALVHLVVSLLKCVALARTLLGKMLSIGCTTALLLIGTHVYKLNTIKVKLQALGHTAQTVGVAQKDRVADALCLSLYSSLHHRWMCAFGKHYALWVHACSIVQVACKLGFLTEQLHKVLLVSVPVGNGFACYSAFDSSLGNSRAHFCDKTWVYWFRYEIFRTEREVVDMINLINNIWHRLLGKVGDGMYGSHLHLLVNSLGMNVEGATEDVRETNNVVNLVRIVASSGRHKHVWAACHSVLVANLRYRIGKGKHNRLVGHRAYHVLREYVAL